MNHIKNIASMLLQPRFQGKCHKMLAKKGINKTEAKCIGAKKVQSFRNRNYRI